MSPHGAKDIMSGMLPNGSTVDAKNNLAAVVLWSAGLPKSGCI